MNVFSRLARKQSWLAALLLVLAPLAIPHATEASLIPTIEEETSGTGLGSVDTVLTIQDTATDTSGCVAWDGSGDVEGPAACPAGIPGGDEQAITRTYALSELDFASAFNLRLVFNYDEPQSGAMVDNITIEDLELTIYQSGGSVCFTSGAFSSVSFPDTFSGVGNSGFVFRLDAQQAAAAQACFDDPANRIGLAAELANAGQGPETFYLADAADLVPASADLSVTKTDSADPATVGSPLSYTLTVTNDGPNAATGVTVVDTVPASLSGVTATSPDGTCTIDGRVVTCDLGELAAGATATVTITGTPTVTGTISNSVTVVADQPDPDTDDNTDSETTQVEDGGGMGGGTDVADLSVTKTDSPDPVMVGDELTYTVTVTNGGPDPAPGTTLTDQLPATVDLSAATVTSGGGSCSSSGQTVVCELGTLAAGDVVTVEITVTPQSTGTIQNTAQVGAEVNDDTPGNNSASESTQVVDVAGGGVDLAVVKSDSADPVAPGATFDYVLEVSNQGTSDATGVTLRDDLPASVTIVSLPPGCSADGNLVTCDLGSLAAGFSTTVTLTVQAPGSETALTNTATVAADQPDTDTADNSDTEGTTVESDPGGPTPDEVDLGVRKSDSPDPVQVGDQIVYRLLVSNAGPDLATGVRVVDDLSPLVSFVSATGGAASCTGTGGAVVCDLSSLAAGESVEIFIAVQAEAAGRATDTVTVAPGGETDVNPANNSDSEDTTIGSTAPVADVSVTKTGSPDPVGVGDILTYTLLVDNAGPATATGVQLTDMLPMEVEYQSSSATQGSCAQATGVVTCDLGTLGVGATATVTIRVRPLVEGPLVNSAVVTADQSDPDTARNVSEAEVTADENVLAIPTASEWGLLMLFLGLGGAGYGLLSRLG